MQREREREAIAKVKENGVYLSRVKTKDDEPIRNAMAVVVK